MISKLKYSQKNNWTYVTKAIIMRKSGRNELNPETEKISQINKSQLRCLLRGLHFINIR